MKREQLILPIALRDELTFDNFYSGKNREVVNNLQKSIANGPEHFIYVSGGSGLGRTHLLQACCHAIKKTAIYLPLGAAGLFPHCLQNIEQVHCICADNVDAVLNHLEWEEALLHCYNRVRDQQGYLIVTANKPPTQLDCTLPDLHSRLSWGLTFQLKALTDTEKIEALQLRARYRGWELSRVVAQYLVCHIPRDMHTLFSALSALDRASLTHQQKITVAFTKKILLL